MKPRRSARRGKGDQQSSPKSEAAQSDDMDTGSEQLDTSQVSETAYDTTFTTKTWREDACLVVEGKELFVSSSMLSLMSPVLGKLFEEKMGTAAAGCPLKLELENKTYDEVVEFLKCIYPNIMKKVTLKNVCLVLPLSVEFEIKELGNRCEIVMLQNIGHLTKTEVILEYLCKAFTYNLPELRRKCINEVAKKTYQVLQKAEKKVPLPAEVKVEIQNIVIDSMKEQLSDQKNKAANKEEHLEEQISDLQQELDDQKEQNLRLAKYENVAKSTCLIDLLDHFGEACFSANLKNPRVGFIESQFSIERKVEIRRGTISIHGIRWSLVVKPEGKNLGVYMYADLLEQNCRHRWQCKAYFKVYLRNIRNQKLTVKLPVSHVYTASGGFGCPAIAKLDEVEKMEAGFLTPQKELKVEAYIIAEEPTFS